MLHENDSELQNHPLLLTWYNLLAQQVWHGKAPTGDYEMVNYWDTKFPTSLFGKNSDFMSSRSALETEPAALAGAQAADSRVGQQQPLRLRRLMMA